MARRRRNSGRNIEAIVPLVGLFVFGMIFLPPFRQAVLISGALIVALACLGMLAFFLVRHLAKKVNRSASNLESHQTLSEDPPLRSYNMTTLEPVPAKSPPPPPAHKDDSRYMPKASVSPSPIIIPELMESTPGSVDADPIFHRHAPPGPPIAKPVHDSFSTDDFIERLRSIDWFQFEKVVALMYEGQGYIVDRRGGANPDGGIDMVIERNGARRAVQCKQWKSWKLPEKTVREFVGAMYIAGITQGVFVILRGCTERARQLAQEREIEIVDEDVLARMLEAAGAPYDPAVRALLDDERKYCPKCESEMVLRTTRKGPNAGGQFWGCSTYPRCNFMMPGP